MKLSRCIIEVLLLSFYHIQYVTAQGKSDEKTLIRHLLYDYDTRARPVINSSAPVQVKFSITPIQIADLDEVNQVFAINVWLSLVWKDERLTWDPKQYNNITKLLLPEDEIWQPDIVLYNSDEFSKLIHTKVVVQNNGEVFWGPPTKYYSACQVNVRYFPFDVQTCEMWFGSWMHDSNQLNLDLKDHKIDTKNYLENGEWSLVNITMKRKSVKYDCCPRPYIFVLYEFKMKRRVVYYMLNIVLPCLWLSVLSVMTFRLPPDSGEKITLGTTVLLAFSVFSLLIAESMPRTSEHIPLIGVYLNLSVSMTSFSTLMTIYILHLHHVGPRQRSLPKQLKNFAFNFLAKFMGMRGIVHDFIKQENDKILIPKTISDTDDNPLLQCSYILQMTARQAITENGTGRNSSSVNDKMNSPHVNEIKRTALFSRELENLIARELCKKEQTRKYEQQQKHTNDEWRLLAIILDRLCFWTYLVIAVIISVSLLVVTPILGEWYSSQPMELDKNVLLD